MDILEDGVVLSIEGNSNPLIGNRDADMADTMTETQARGPEHHMAYGKEQADVDNVVTAQAGLYAESSTANTQIAEERAVHGQVIHDVTRLIQTQEETECPTLNLSETSLFIPEERITSPSRATSLFNGTASSASTTSRPAIRPLSTFARIRALQQKAKIQKSKEIRLSTLPQPYLDNESFLEAIQPGPASSGGPANTPTSSKDNIEDREAASEFQRQKEIYDRKRQNGGNLSFRHEVEWLRLERAERVRLAKKDLDAEKVRDDNLDDDLFPPEYPRSGNVTGNHRHEDDENDSGEGDIELDISESRKRRRPTMPVKEFKTPSLQELELHSMEVALEADKDLPKKKRKNFAPVQHNDESRSKTRALKSRATAATSPQVLSSEKGRKSAKQKKATEQAVRQVQSLMGSNVFKQQPPENAREAPKFTTRNKNKALKELLASVPVGDQKTLKSDMAALLSASKDFDGKGSARIDGAGMWRVKGMATSLKAYQLLGSAFMRRRENAPEEPRGGLLADQMGLGKTLMMLANIVNGLRRHAQCKTTLIIASPSLLTQWCQEIKVHTNAGLKVVRYGPGNRIDSNCSFAVLEWHDIILTTYHEVMNSYPKTEPPINCQTSEEKLEWWKRTYENDRGVLHRMKFHRIVLDEAQAIKNHSSRTSIACRALMANHRWALSGTPILNSLTELYPYFKFIDVPFTGSFKIFKQNYCDAGSAESSERLLVRLSQFMLRRTHGEWMFDAPILKLPRADQRTHVCDFNPVERQVYDIVQRRFIDTINAWQAGGTLDKSYSNILVMLLRLRQLSSHILMLQYVMRDLLLWEDIERIREVVRDCAVDNRSARGRYIIAIRWQLEDYAGEAKNRPASATAMDNVDCLPDGEDKPLQDPENGDGDGAASEEGSDHNPFGAVFGTQYDFQPYLKSLTTGKSWQQKKKMATCGYGDHKLVHPHITTCKHLICQKCYEEAFERAAEEEKVVCLCPVCQTRYQRAHVLDSDYDDIDEYTAPETRSSKKRTKPKPKRIGQEDIADDWLRFSGANVLPSAKTIAVKAQIINWIKENPKVKIIIYTQFLAMVRILNKMCEEEGFVTEQYHGKLSLTARDKAITNFADNPNISILLASLRCGGLGLNLTMASKVIMIDLWWNSAIEQQAFCRVFRYGQTEKTALTRFVVRGTVDDRLLAMQKRKEKEIDEVMEDGGKTVDKMSVRDLMRLFGNVQDDQNGKPFILVDNPDSRGGFGTDADHEGYADEL